MKILIQALIIIGITGFLGMLEAALFTVSLSRARVLAAQDKKGANSLLIVKQNMARSIFLLVVFVNISTVLGSIILGKNAAEEFGGSVGLISALMTIGIILFGELIPKSLGDKYSERIGCTFAPFILFITKVFSPIIWVYEKVILSFIGEHVVPVSEDDLRVLSETSHSEGGIELDEKEIILNTFRMNDITAEDIMTPRSVVEMLPAHITLRQALGIIGEKPYSRIPVYADTVDQVMGYVSVKDILRGLAHNEYETLIEAYMKPITKISTKTRSDDLLALFQKNKIHCAIVVDEFNQTAGLVTLEDVLEILVGEIMDETDEHEDLRQVASDQGR